MSARLEPVTIPAEGFDTLRRETERMDEITPFARDPRLCERIACLGIARETGTVNDELARFVFDADRGVPVRPESLAAELVRWKEHLGVKVRSRESKRLELRSRHLTEVIHPGLSYAQDGSLESLVIFPALVARVAALEGVELVVVKSWARNSIFGGFDPAQGYYQTNFWELESNDTLVFSGLVGSGRLALLGTHDLIAHVAGIRREPWDRLRNQATAVHDAIRDYFVGVSRPTVASLILPYTIGVVLDDLAQPPTYGSHSHGIMLEALLRELGRRAVPPDFRCVLTRFPKAFEAIIEAARSPDLDAVTAEALVRRLSFEVRAAAARTA